MKARSYIAIDLKSFYASVECIQRGLDPMITNLVVADPSKVLLKPDTLDKLAVREVSLQTKDAARTLCVTVNPVSAYGWKFDKDVFIDRMRQSVKVPVINVKEELA